uniref:Uncharacterized protein n=1 Tax=Oryza barthii TaxID=65489 RepID=A0A0D3GNY7_9ORYZ
MPDNGTVQEECMRWRAIGPNRDNSSDVSACTIKYDFTMPYKTIIKASNVALESEAKVEDVKYKSKPRTALFQGREGDEPMTHQDVHGDMTSDNSIIKYGKIMEKFTSAGLSSNIFFRGVNFHKKREEKKQRKYIQIGCIQVDVT